ncbi:MAG: hypothetical protein ACK559_42285, partial [bacterium]
QELGDDGRRPDRAELRLVGKRLLRLAQREAPVDHRCQEPDEVRRLRLLLGPQRPEHVRAVEDHGLRGELAVAQRLQAVPRRLEEVEVPRARGVARVVARADVLRAAGGVRAERGRL